ncbi:hypothetical protein DITRI_Ditri14bG0103700 [Diplodiscus trichospermus]
MVERQLQTQPDFTTQHGILRDSSANVLMVFSKSIGVTDSNLAELLAVREVFILFTSSERVQSHNLVVESDSKDVKEWSIVHVLREANAFADGLAKAGVHIMDDLVEIFNR